jgi:hypothetical protein
MVIVTWIIFAVFGGAYRMAFGTATAFVLRTVYGSFFPYLSEEQDAEAMEYEDGVDICGGPNKLQQQP